MIQLQTYVDSIVKDLPVDENEKRELAEELLLHLTEHVHELMQEGVSEQQAIELAVSAFGNEQKLQQQFKKTMFPYYKWLRFSLCVSVVTFIMGQIAMHLPKLSTKYYTVHLNVEQWLFLFVVCTVLLGIGELLLETLTKEYNLKAFANPWLFFITPTLIVEAVLILDYVSKIDVYGAWIWHDILLWPVVFILYVVVRQLFTALFVRKQHQHIVATK